MPASGRPSADTQSSAPVAPGLHDVHIQSITELTAPCELLAAAPVSEAAAATVTAGRRAVQRVLAGDDQRLLVVVGPCSIHDEQAALDYAGRLASLANELADRLLVVMRVYFEKPRTIVGWKGLVNDPHLDGSFDIQEGLRLGRRILLQINELGLPCGTEILDPITPQYMADLVTWASIGARTTESQTHRQMASGLSMPVGFKNGTDGSLETAINALLAARHPHAFLGIDSQGRTCVIQTTGNPWGHLILRGGKGGTNYGPDAVGEAFEALAAADLPTGLLVDCSHANAQKDHNRQCAVFRSVLEQRRSEDPAGPRILGVMLESNLVAGNQKLSPGTPGSKLTYGQSITDACLGWEETATLLREAAGK